MDSSRIVWDGGRGANVERTITLDPGQHILSVRYWNVKGYKTLSVSAVKYDFRPGVAYRIKGIDKGDLVVYEVLTEAAEMQKNKQKYGSGTNPTSPE